MATRADPDAAPEDAVIEAEDLEAPLGRRLLAEFVGTLLFVTIGAGAATVLFIGEVERQAELPQEADPLQLRIFNKILENTFGDVLGVALAFGVGLAVLVYAFGGVSGAHFNPAVTLALAVVRRFRWKDVPAYWVVQCLGGIAGAFVVAGIYRSSEGAVDGAHAEILFGATRIADGLGNQQAILAEAAIAFLLMTAIMAVAVDPRAPKGWSGIVIGLALVGGILFTVRATGGSANFARSLGPFVAAQVFDAGSIPWADLLVYAAGPIVGAATAALIYEGVTGLELASPAPQPGSATPLKKTASEQNPEDSKPATARGRKPAFRTKSEAGDTADDDADPKAT